MMLSSSRLLVFSNIPVLESIHFTDGASYPMIIRLWESQDDSFRSNSKRLLLKTDSKGLKYFISRSLANSMSKSGNQSKCDIAKPRFIVRIISDYISLNFWIVTSSVFDTRIAISSVLDKGQQAENSPLNLQSFCKPSNEYISAITQDPCSSALINEKLNSLSYGFLPDNTDIGYRLSEVSMERISKRSRCAGSRLSRESSVASS